MGVKDISVSAYGKYLAQYRDSMMGLFNLDYRRVHNRNGTLLTLTRIFDEDADE